jgi:hypothetical protein
MSSTLSPNGLTPSRRWGSSPNSTGTNMYNIADGYATALFTGALVEVSAGNITILANSTNTGAAPIGVFQGCQYTALNGTPTWSAYWPAATSVMSGSQAIGYVCDDPFATFTIQADGAVSAQNLMTTNYEVNIGTGGSTFTGVDNTSLKANSGVTTAAALVRPIAYEATPGNTQASAYPRLEVELIHHALRAGAVA